MATGIWLPSRSAMAGAAPRYGTCSILMPAARFRASPANCMVLPVPGVP
ncbi:Uncharacterised protein [Bordetella pertussis]|nr:Uncharacterised protein [Bordetella pertussis]